ncbi:DcaP family trimeric outer membrane transporter [Croceicoccus gelatinilyticus]|uniref:DcaP family trimeric outer membrane transporter n=1 Tax=Croceicoccus gelatinilyticus TaxID=2835536 RepID=UPI001BD0B8D9|nr:DcaP family trimeric outer membrane transporter [Croceicoccus gelatinilyticus]MBS7670609.1 porin [Croceicoccus gelatinilyticus]
MYKNTSGKALRRSIAAGLLAATAMAPAAAHAQSSVEDRLDKLEAMIMALEARMDAQQSAPADPQTQAAVTEMRAAVAETRAVAAKQGELETRVAAVETSDKSGFHIGDTQVTIGGYVKMDAITARTSAGQLGGDTFLRDFLIPSTVPVGTGAGSGWDTDFNARQTRFAIKTATPVAGKTLGTTMEMDFMVTSGGDERITNSYTPRLRHAFVTYDGWTIGQTWGTFFNVGALPDTLDFIGTTPGTVFIRQPLVRYTTKSGFSIAVEQPETTVTTATGGRVTPGDDSLPDVVLRFDKKAGKSAFSIAAIGRQLKVSNDDFGLGSDSTLGYGVSVSGKIGIGEKDDFRFMVNAGEGLGRYIGLNIVNDAAIDPATGDLDAIASYSGFAAYRHVWGDKLRSTIAGSYFKADNPVALTSTSPTDTVWNALANVIYTPVPKLDLGVEYMYVERENEAGLDGNLQKVQVSAKYSF